MQAYLAGPDVFYPSANSIGKEKQRLCENHGVKGLYPLDNEIGGSDLGYAIFRANKRMMDQADFCIANLTPFRGTSADVGTVMEAGYMLGCGKPVFAYSNDPWHYLNRVLTDDRFAVKRDGNWYDIENKVIENFDLRDNLMLDGFIRYQGFDILVPEGLAINDDDDLSVFERCLKSAVDNMHFRIRDRFVYDNKCGEIELPKTIPVHMFGEK